MKPNISLRIAAVLLCLTLISIHLTSGMLARYTTNASAADSARVAGFGRLTLTETKTDYQIVPGAAITKDAKVTMSACEVAVRIYVTIKATGWSYSNGALVYSITVGENTIPVLTATLTGWTHKETSGSTYVFYRDLAPSDTAQTISVFAGDQIAVSSTISYENYYKLVNALNMDISARAEQID